MKNKEFENFSATTKRLLGVSKEEFNRREAEWKKQRKAAKKAAKKPTGRGASRDSGGGT
jgi:hypothetical protein